MSKVAIPVETQDHSENEKTIQEVIGQIWYRARINAFAHKAAANEASRSAQKHFRQEILATLAAILCVIIVYSISENTQSNGVRIPLTDVVLYFNIGFWKIAFTLLSVGFTLWSLYQSVMGGNLHLDVQAEAHRNLMNSYQYIAQRSREAKWPDRTYGDLLALLKDLERDFQVMKARGIEPEHHHFNIAHGIVHEIRGDEDVRIAQSFPVGAIDEAAQRIGVPQNGEPEHLPVEQANNAEYLQMDDDQRRRARTLHLIHRTLDSWHKGGVLLVLEEALRYLRWLRQRAKP